MQVVATILGAVKAITLSMRSLALVPQVDNGSEQRSGSDGSRKKSNSGTHKWVLVAGAVVGLMTVAYLENIVNGSRQRPDPASEPATEERFEGLPFQ